MADLYKEPLVFDMAFDLTGRMGGIYDRHRAVSAFRERVIAMDFMRKCPEDILNLLELKK